MDASKLKLPALLENLGNFTMYAADCARLAGFGQKRVSEIELAVEEAVMNIVSHAYAGKEGYAEISCRSADGSLLIELADEGRPFNILDLPDPDVTADIDERKIGGLGVFFIKKLMDDVRYEREGNRNRLTLTVRRPGAEAM